MKALEHYPGFVVFAKHGGFLVCNGIIQSLIGSGKVYDPRLSEKTGKSCGMHKHKHEGVEPTPLERVNTRKPPQLFHKLLLPIGR